MPTVIFREVIFTPPIVALNLITVWGVFVVVFFAGVFFLLVLLFAPALLTLLTVMRTLYTDSQVTLQNPYSAPKPLTDFILSSKIVITRR